MLFFVGSECIALLNPIEPCSSLLEGKWDDDFISPSENKMNLKICLYCKSTEVIKQCNIVYGTFAVHFQLFP